MNTTHFFVLHHSQRVDKSYTRSLIPSLFPIYWHLALLGCIDNSIIILIMVVVAECSSRRPYNGLSMESIGPVQILDIT